MKRAKKELNDLATQITTLMEAGKMTGYFSRVKCVPSNMTIIFSSRLPPLFN